MSVKLLIEFNLVFLSLTGGCTGSSESTLVKIAHCWKSHVTVQIFLNTGPRRQSVTCLTTDACLTADPGVTSLIAARSHTFMEIDHEIFSGGKVTVGSHFWPITSVKSDKTVWAVEQCIVSRCTYLLTIR